MANQKETAEHLGVSDRQVRNWHLLPGFPVPTGKGGYDLDKARFWYIAYLKNGRAQKHGEYDEDEDEDEQYEREKKQLTLEEKRLKIDNNRHNLLIKQKQYAPIYIIELFCNRLSSGLATHFDACIGRIKRRHPDISIEHIETLKKEMALARNELADAEPDLSDFLESDDESSEAGDETS